MMRCLPVLILTSLAATAAAAPGGFTGPSGVRSVTTAEVVDLKDDTRVRMTGHIVRALGDEEYEFDDGNGTLVVEIDDDEWQGLDVDPDTRVELTGEIDSDGRGVELDVDELRAVRE